MKKVVIVFLMFMMCGSKVQSTEEPKCVTVEVCDQTVTFCHINNHEKEWYEHDGRTYYCENDDCSEAAKRVVEDLHCYEK